MDQRAVLLVCVREGAAACHVNARDAGRRVAQQSVAGSAHFLKLELFFMWLRHAVKPVSTAPQPAQVNTAVFDLGSGSPSRLSRRQLLRSLTPLLLVGALLPPWLAVMADARSFFLMPPPATPASAAASFAFLTRSSGIHRATDEHAGTADGEKPRWGGEATGPPRISNALVFSAALWPTL